MTVVLKIGRAGFALLIAIVSASGTLAASIIPQYVDRDIAIPLVTFLTAIVSALIVYLMTEQQLAPPEVPPSPGLSP